MKKLLSIVLSLVMLASVGMATIPALAATVGSQETTAAHNRIITQVNGKDSDDIEYEWISDSPKTIKFTYNGDGKVTGWSFGNLKEGTDYKVVDSTSTTITIELLRDYDGDITANAEVEFASGATTKKATTGKSNKSSTSPKTGAAAAAGIAAMGAGIAVLAAAKKKED